MTTMMATMASANAQQATRQAVRLYRSSLRAVPEMIRSYELEVSESEARQRIRAEFNKHTGVQNSMVIDMLVFRGQSELEEVKNVWKSRTHMVGFFTTKQQAPRRFIERFADTCEISEE